MGCCISSTYNLIFVTALTLNWYLFQNELFYMFMLCFGFLFSGCCRWPWHPGSQDSQEVLHVLLNLHFFFLFIFMQHLPWATLFQIVADQLLKPFCDKKLGGWHYGWRNLFEILYLIIQNFKRIFNINQYK